MKKKRGGYRPNAGRKVGKATLEAEAMRAAIAAEISKNLPGLIEVAMSKALKGDLGFFKELMDRGYGRPPQSNDITSNGKEITAISEAQMVKLSNVFLAAHGTTHG